MGVKENGEKFMRARMEESAVRLLTNIFQVGLFENPYLDVNISKETVGNPEFMKAGFDAQLKSIVMLKNRGGVLPQKGKATVYIPKRYVPATRSFMGTMSEARWTDPVNHDIVNNYFNISDKPATADFGIVFIESPNS